MRWIAGMSLGAILSINNVRTILPVFASVFYGRPGETSLRESSSHHLHVYIPSEKTVTGPTWVVICLLLVVMALVELWWTTLLDSFSLILSVSISTNVGSSDLKRFQIRLGSGWLLSRVGQRDVVLIMKMRVLWDAASRYLHAAAIEIVSTNAV